jgi:hypothetical protein
MLGGERIMSLRPFALFVALFVLISGCDDGLPKQNEVKFQEDAGDVDVATTMLAPWHDYMPILQPQFSLSAQDALARVLPTTGTYDERTSSTISGALAITGPTVTSPAAPPSATTAVASGLSPSAPTLTRPTNSDAMLQYSAAAALFQEVSLLNKTVSAAALRHGYIPYIARLQISVRPHSHNLPYDINLTISFFTGDSETNSHGYPADGPQRNPYVLPILVTDDLEGVTGSQTTEQLRAVSLALSAAAKGVGGAGALNDALDKWKTTLGTDVNGLITTGRIADNSIAVRLGAQYQPKGGYAMTSRNYNLSVVMMVPEEYVRKFMGPINIDPTVLDAVAADLQISEPTVEATRKKVSDEVQWWAPNGCAVPLPEGKSEAKKALYDLIDHNSNGAHIRKCMVDRRPRVRIQLDTTMRHAGTGKALQVKDRHALFDTVRSSLVRLPGFENVSDEVMLGLIRYVAADNMPQFACVATLLDRSATWNGESCEGPDPKTPLGEPQPVENLDATQQQRLRLASVLWTEVASHMSQFSIQGATIDLPYEVPAYIRPDQLVLVSSGNGRLTARVSDVSGLDPVLYKATLSFNNLPSSLDDKNDVEHRTLIYADSLTLDPQAHTLTAVFPTFTTAKGVKSDDLSHFHEMVVEPVWTEEQTFERTVWHPTAAALNSRSESFAMAERFQNGKSNNETHYERRPFIFTKFANSGLNAAAEAGGPASFTLTSAEDTIQPLVGGTASMRVFVSDSKADQIVLSIRNAVSVSAVSVAGSGSVKSDGGIVTVTGASATFDLSLQGLVSGRNVVLTAEGSKSDPSGKAVPSSIIRHTATVGVVAPQAAATK